MVNYILIFDVINNQVSYSPINSNAIMTLIMEVKIKKGETIPNSVIESIPTGEVPFIVDLESEFPPKVQKWLKDQHNIR